MPTLRQKTIRVPVNFGNVSSFPNNTLTSIGTPTIYIPENGDSAVTFKSVMLFYSWQDTATGISTSGTRLQTITTELQLQDAFSSSSITFNANPVTTLLNTGENQSMVFGPVDYTTYFNTDTGWDSDQISQTCEVKILMYTDTGVTTDWQKVYSWLDITYEYDADAGTNRIQTVCIPYESYNTYLPTTPTEIGTLPQLTSEGGILDGYNTPVVRHRWIEIKGNSYISNANFYIKYSFNGDTPNNLPAMTGSLASGLYETYLIDASSLDEGTTHTFELGASNIQRWPSIIINEWVTFEYITTGTTRVLNYMEVPLELESATSGPTSASNSSFSREILIPETNITQLNCAAEINANGPQGPWFFETKAGSQSSYKSYLLNASIVAGSYAYQHRLDSGSSLGEGISLQSGLNTLSLFIYQSSTLRSITNLSGVIKLLYLSDVSSTGIDNHTQTVRSIIRQPEIANLGLIVTANNTASLTIPNDDYYIQTLGLQYNTYTSVSVLGINIKARILPGEGIGEGYRTLYSDMYLSEPELTYTPMYVRARDEFKRYPGDPDNNRMDVQSNREYIQTNNQNTKIISANFFATYHGITHIISGSVTGSSDLTSSLQLFQVVDGEYNLYKTGSAEGDTDFQFTVYDDTTPYIVSAYASSSLKGISKSSTPTTGFDIDYAAGGGGGAGGEFFF